MEDFNEQIALLDMVLDKLSDDEAALVKRLLSLARVAALDEAREAAYDHSCRGYLCNCSGHIMDAIRALMDQPKENQ